MRSIGLSTWRYFGVSKRSLDEKKAALVCIAAIAILIGFQYLWNQMDDYSTALNMNWGIELPRAAHYSEIYKQDSGACFHGDGILYHVFSCEAAKPIDEMLAWKDSEEKTVYFASYQEAVTAWLNEINVPADEAPNVSDCVYWYVSCDDHSEMILLWNSNFKRIYAVESFL